MKRLLCLPAGTAPPWAFPLVLPKRWRRQSKPGENSAPFGSKTSTCADRSWRERPYFSPSTCRPGTPPPVPGTSRKRCDAARVPLLERTDQSRRRSEDHRVRREFGRYGTKLAAPTIEPSPITAPLMMVAFMPTITRSPMRAAARLRRARSSPRADLDCRSESNAARSSPARSSTPDPHRPSSPRSTA